MIDFKKEFDFLLVVITRGRASLDQQVALSVLHPELRKQVVVACHPGEAEIHEQMWGDQITGVVEYEATHVGEVRHWCIENLDSRYIMFFEDNISLHVRADAPDIGNVRKHGLYEATHLRWNDENVLKHQTNMIIDIIDKFSEGDYGIIGVSQRFGNNREPEDFSDFKRIYGLWAIDCELYKKIDYKFSDIDLREDFYVELGFLLSGYKTGNFYKYAFDKENGVNSKGGCSTYRTPEKTNNNALFLQEKFPGIVKAVNKEKKTWAGYDGKVIDVHIQWAKAYKQGIENRLKNEKL